MASINKLHLEMYFDGKNVDILIKCVPRFPIDNKYVLVYGLAWYRRHTITWNNDDQDAGRQVPPPTPRHNG